MKPSATTTSPKVMTVVLNYNRAEDTIECVRSLQQCSYSSKEIIVVDNGSNDDSLKRFRDGLGGIEIVSTGENLGFTGGVNFSIRRVLEKHPDYLLLLNNDTVVSADFLTHLVDAMEKRPGAAAACGTILCHHDPTRIWYAGGKLIPWRGLAVHLRKNEKVNFEQLDGARSVTFVTGCMMLMRASFLRDIGPLDERLFMFLDDIELSARILDKGFDLLYVPRAVVYHKVLGETENQLKVYYSVRNRLLVISTAFRGLSKIVATTYFLSVIALKLLVWRFTNPKFYRAALYGMEDYFSKRFYKGRGFSEKFYQQ